MRLSWMFGNSMAAHHLLAAYVAVWLIQGGYAGWVASQWASTGRDLRQDALLDSQTDEDE